MRKQKKAAMMLTYNDCKTGQVGRGEEDVKPILI